MSGLDYERAVLAAGPLGIMQACIDTVLPYTNQRKQFNRPISDFQVYLYYIFILYIIHYILYIYIFITASSGEIG